MDYNMGFHSVFNHEKKNILLDITVNVFSHRSCEFQFAYWILFNNEIKFEI